MQNKVSSSLATTQNILDLFMKVSSNMLVSADLNTFIEESLADVGRMLNVHRSYIFKKVQDNWELTLSWVAPTTPPFVNFVGGESPQKVFEEDNMFGFLEAGKPYIINSIDTFSNKAGAETLKKVHIVSLIIVPLFSDGKLVALFGVDQCSHVENWVQKNLNAVITVGHLLNNALNYFNSLDFLKKREEETQELLDALPFPIYISNPQTYEMLCCNKMTCDHVGDSNPLYKKCYKVIFNYDSPCEFCKTSCLSPNSEPFIWDLTIDHLQADFKVIDSFIQWHDVEQAKLTIALDIADSLRLQREQVLERESSKAKSRFLANMSHELRTPLNGIIGMTNLAIQDNENPKISDYLDKIQFSSKNLLTIINNILDFSKMEAGKLELEHHIFSPGEVCKNTVEDYREHAKSKGISLKYFIDANTPSALLGDSLRFSQILLHLIKNAIAFTEEGGVCISLYTATKNSENNKQLLRLIIQDSGIGMTEQETKQLFYFFTQADSSSTRRHGGTGLGLAIVDHLITLMGGEISVESTVGKGTTFTCHIPFVLPQSDDALLFTAQEEHNLPQGLRILLTEDNEINSLIAYEILTRLGCVVDCAHDGIQALEYLEKKSYDLVFMDVQMPHMNGIEATEHIRKDARFDTLPIVALTAHILTEEIDKCYASGMQSHVLKPISTQTLTKALTEFAQKNFTFSR